MWVFFFFFEDAWVESDSILGVATHLGTRPRVGAGAGAGRELDRLIVDWVRAKRALTGSARLSGLRLHPMAGPDMAAHIGEQCVLNAD